MSKNCIKIGEWNKQYKYLILTIIFSILKDFALGTSNEVTFQEIKALDGGEISNCFLVREALCYLFTILLSRMDILDPAKLVIFFKKHYM